MPASASTWRLANTSPGNASRLFVSEHRSSSLVIRDRQLLMRRPVVENPSATAGELVDAAAAARADDSISDVGGWSPAMPTKTMGTLHSSFRTSGCSCSDRQADITGNLLLRTASVISPERHENSDILPVFNPSAATPESRGESAGPTRILHFRRIRSSASGVKPTAPSG